MYVMYYASILWCWQLVMILIKTNHPCLRVGHHSFYQGMLILYQSHHGIYGCIPDRAIVPGGNRAYSST
jgi:hypothetical protein